MKNVLFISILMLYCTASSFSSNEHIGESCHSEKHARLDIFHEILEEKNVTGTTLSVNILQTFLNNLYGYLKCLNDSQQENGCAGPVCINANDLTRAASVNAVVNGISEDDFTNVSLVLLFNMINHDAECAPHSSHSVTDMKQKLLTLMSPRDNAITREGIDNMLDSLKKQLLHDHDDGHDGHEEGDEHKHNDDEDGEHHDDPNDDHGTHNHTVARKRRATDHIDDHEHDNDHGDEEHHDDHKHKEEMHRDVVEAKCLDADSILYYLGHDLTNSVPVEHMDEIPTSIVYLISQGYEIEDNCRVLPSKAAFVQHVFEEISGNKETLNLHSLESLMTRMKINPEEEEEEDHGDDHDDHSGHDHRRRRRSAGDNRVNLAENEGQETIRLRRSAGDTDPELSKCYTARQLMSLYDVSNSLNHQAFQQLCPSLISQSLYGHCQKETEEKHNNMHEHEKYIYSTLATLVICLCSIVGIIIIPFASRSVYNFIMALFMGLSCGTLFADAVLHLIPLALGVHAHAHGHKEIVVEKPVQFGLVIIAGLYVFYLVEIFMTNCTGHSHDHNDHDVKEVYVNSGFDDTEKGQKDDKVMDMNMDSLKDQKPKSGSYSKGMPPVALMIVIGDGLHNFADGLAIGAAFSNSSSVGIATSIAVFCHELPHELGDFAVMLKSGLSYKKALIFNVLSSLTALVGLYVGLNISNDEEIQKWIFAASAGMFFYIGLVDVMPMMIKARKGYEIFVNNIGILLGFGLMFLIAVFEEHIEV